MGWGRGGDMRRLESSESRECCGEGGPRDEGGGGEGSEAWQTEKGLKGMAEIERREA